MNIREGRIKVLEERINEQLEEAKDTVYGILPMYSVNQEHINEIIGLIEKPYKELLEERKRNL